VASTPTVVGDGLAVGSCSGTLHLLDRNTGEPIWRYDTRNDAEDTYFHGTPLVTEELILIGTDGKQTGYVYAFEKETGKVRWKYQAGSGTSDRGGVRTDIVGLGSSVYVVTFGEEAISLDLDTGRVNWTFPGIHHKRSPVVRAGSVFFAGVDGTVYALDAASGQMLWKKKLGAPVSTSLSCAGDDLYVGSSNGRVYRLNPKTGTVLAEFAPDGRPIRRLIVSGDSLLVFLDTGGKPTEADAVTCLDRSLEQVRWSQSTPTEWWALHPRVWSDALLVGDRRGVVCSYRVTDGSKQWSRRFKGSIRTIGASDEAIYVSTLEGLVYAYAPEQQR
jgi:outer membrane protein assembly factor BamB